MLAAKIGSAGANSLSPSAFFNSVNNQGHVTNIKSGGLIALRGRTLRSQHSGRPVKSREKAMLIIETKADLLSWLEKKILASTPRKTMPRWFLTEFQDLFSDVEEFGRCAIGGSETDWLLYLEQRFAALITTRREETKASAGWSNSSPLPTR